eukprot:m51a1_g10552 putative condensin-2 complex subunit g2 (1131) ;mRNA; f:40842-44746
MAESKDLLAALECDDPTALCSWSTDHSSDRKAAAEEAMQTRAGEPKAAAALVLRAVQALAVMVPSRGDDEVDAAHSESAARSAAAAIATCALCAKALDECIDKDAEPPEELCEAVVALHSCVYDLMRRGEDAAANDVSCALESWWSRVRPRRDEIVPLMVTFLLVRVLDSAPGQPTAASDIKRIYSVRLALTRIEYADDNAVTIKRLLAKAAMHVPLLRNDQGRKLLAFALQLHPSVSAEIHQVVKCHLRHSPRFLVDNIAEMYFRAWSTAQGSAQISIERDLVQDIMHCAVHVGQKRVSSALLSLLSYFHARKPHKGVDAMLERAYRHADAPPLVRLNASRVFMDAFPIHDPESPQRVQDEELQRQFDLLGTLLHDAHEGVRRAAVPGVCRILCTYWELIPAATAASLLHTLADELAFDKSSPAVRAAVLRGFRAVIDGTHLSHSALAGLLPRVAPLAHDSSERVREAFAELMLYTSNIRTMPRDYVPLAQVVYRVSCDPPALGKKWSKLLLPLFMPVHKSSKTLMGKAFRLIEANKIAAIKFYKYCTTLDIPPTVLCKLLARMSQYFLKQTPIEAISRRLSAMPDSKAAAKELTVVLPTFEDSDEEGEVKEEDDDDADAKKPRRKGRKGKRSHEEHRREAEEDKGPVLASECLDSLLEVMAALWKALYPTLSGDNEFLRETLSSAIDVEKLFDSAKKLGTARARQLSLEIVAFLPEIPRSLDLSLSEELQSISHDTSADTYEPLIECLFARGRGRDVLSQIICWLCGEDDEDSSAPSLAIKLFGFIMANKQTRAMAFAFADELQTVTNKLLSNVSAAQKEIESGNDFVGDLAEVQVNSLVMYLKFLIHTMAASDEKDPPVIEQLLRWTDEFLLPKLKVGEGEMTGILAQTVSIFASELVAVGLSGPRIIEAAVELFKKMLLTCNKRFVATVAPHLCKFIYHLHHEGTFEAQGTELLFEAIRNFSEEAFHDFLLADILALHHARSSLQIITADLVPVLLEPACGEGPSAESERELPPAFMFLIRTALKSPAFLSALMQHFKELQMAGDVPTIWKTLDVVGVLLEQSEPKGLGRTPNLSAVQELLMGLVTKLSSGGSLSGTASGAELTQHSSSLLHLCNSKCTRNERLAK